MGLRRDGNLPKGSVRHQGQDAISECVELQRRKSGGAEVEKVRFVARRQPEQVQTGSFVNHKPSSHKSLNYAFAANRPVAVEALKRLISAGHRPRMLLLGGEPDQECHAQLRHLCSDLGPDLLFTGKPGPEVVDVLAGLDLDYLICVHYPHFLPEDVLDAPRIGSLNLHPAYLPFNRGWHTPSWAILEGTPAGATLHFMSGGIDEGDIVLQEQVDVLPTDTAHSLYCRILDAEVELLDRAIPLLVAADLPRKAQDLQAGTTHRREDLWGSGVVHIDGDETVTASEILLRMRALTTSDWSEALTVHVGDRRFRIQVQVQEDCSDV